MLFTIRKWAQVSLPKHSWFWYLSTVIKCFSISVFLWVFRPLTAFAFLRNPLSSKELGFTHAQLTILQINNGMDFKWLTKFISCQIRAKDDSAFTPADIWVVKYKYGYNYLFPICNPIVAFSSKMCSTYWSTSRCLQPFTRRLIVFALPLARKYLNTKYSLRRNIMQPRNPLLN